MVLFGQHRADDDLQVKTRIQQHVNAQLQQMQHDLQSFLRQQDTALQEQVQQQLESQEEALEKLQSTLLSRIERRESPTVLLGGVFCFR